MYEIQNLEMKTEYLDSVKKQMLYYKMIAEKTFDQLEDEKIFWQYNQESNSISSIIKHLSGNMISRWTDFLTSDGEKSWRNRELEFESTIKTKEELLETWNKGWKCFFDALEMINEENFNSTIYIRNQGQSLIDALNRQLAHYPYHIGQIVFIGKMILDEKWLSLSIPKGKSNIYNEEKFSKPKKNQHFTDEYLDTK